MAQPRFTAVCTAIALGSTSLAALAQSPASVTFGRITAVAAVTQESARAQTGGAIVGGTLGAAVGSGRSGSNRALGGIGGAFAGQQIGRLMTQSQAYEYTILVDGTSTIRFVSDQGGLRTGDCVAVERGSFNNIRLVADAKCGTPARQGQAAAAPPRPTPADARKSDQCLQAKEQLLAAEDQDAFDRAERRVRLLCND